MKKLVLAAIAFALLPLPSRAQDTPKADVAVGFSHLQIIKGFTIPMEGASGSVGFTANDWLGLVGDVGVYNNSGGGLVAETYTFGPRFSYRKITRFVPFAQALFGGVHFSESFGGAPGSVGNHFVFAFGVGADIALGSGKIALRPQGDYFNLPLNGSVIGNARLSIGIVYRIGTK